MISSGLRIFIDVLFDYASCFNKRRLGCFGSTNIQLRLGATSLPWKESAVVELPKTLFLIAVRRHAVAEKEQLEIRFEFV